MSNFWSGLFGGSNGTLNNSINQTSSLGNWAAGQGQGDISAGDSFMRAILSGDSSKTAQALAPAISADKKSTQQDIKTSAMLGGRTGGTAAANNAASDKVHSDITNLIGNLTGGAASSLLSSGSNLLNTGISGINSSAELSQQRLSNWQNSIFGGALTGGAATGLKALSNWAVPGQSGDSGGF